MNNLPQKIKLTIHGEEIDFSLTGKREIKYHGKTKTSNESLWRTDKLEDDEVFYQSEWGWGVFVTIEERELSLEERHQILTDNISKLNGMPMYVIYDGLEREQANFYDKENIPTKIITVTYKDTKIESYE
jgi:hypothetical protein